MSFNQNFHTKYCEKPRLNILISRGDIKGDTGLMGYTVYWHSERIYQPLL
jgi:hypothetical protein